VFGAWEIEQIDVARFNPGTPVGPTIFDAVEDFPVHPTDPLLVFTGEDAWSIQFPNVIDQLLLKRLRLQIAFATEDSDPFPGGISVTGFDPEGPVEAELVSFLAITPPPTDGIIQDWELEPNPDWEIIDIPVGPNTFINQIVLDMISIPEPASWMLALFGLVGLVALKIRRR